MNNVTHSHRKEGRQKGGRKGGTKGGREGKRKISHVSIKNLIDSTVKEPRYSIVK